MRFLGIGLAVLCVLVGFVYFSPSYQLGREAKEELERGNFEEAHQLAIEALDKDSYNRLAYSVENQSRQRLRIQEFLKKTKQDQESAFAILKDGTVTSEEVLRLQWLVDAFQTGYRALLILNQPNMQEKQQLEQYVQWYEDLEARLKAAKLAKHAK